MSESKSPFWEWVHHQNEQIRILKEKNIELAENLERTNVALMEKSAEYIELHQEKRYLDLTIELYLTHEEKGHNRCWANKNILCEARGKKTQDNDFSIAEFLQGCPYYAEKIYPNLSDKEKNMTNKLKQIIREFMIEDGE